ncbi:hypothetical protein C8Q74DRAFT_85507 [Fomes fomentarius]|nr:hypothetical protein C8Q74DRAFT_85507 [Fomes fomentarius]
MVHNPSHGDFATPGAGAVLIQIRRPPTASALFTSPGCPPACAGTRARQSAPGRVLRETGGGEREEGVSATGKTGGIYSQLQRKGSGQDQRLRHIPRGVLDEAALRPGRLPERCKSLARLSITVTPVANTDTQCTRLPADAPLPALRAVRTGGRDLHTSYITLPFFQPLLVLVLLRMHPRGLSTVVPQILCSVCGHPRSQIVIVPVRQRSPFTL